MELDLKHTSWSKLHMKNYKVMSDRFNIFGMYFFPMAQQPLVGQGLLIIESSLSHSDTPHLVGLLWTRDQLVAETSTWEHSTHKRQTSMLPAGFEPTIPANERPQTHALDRAATGIGYLKLIRVGNNAQKGRLIYLYKYSIIISAGVAIYIKSFE
jgi:hypothetical protein